MVMDPGQVNAIYRLHHEEKWSKRRIARELGIGRKTINKYLQSPAALAAPRKPRKTKLDDFKPVIRELVERDRKASAVVIAERLRRKEALRLLPDYVSNILLQARSPRQPPLQLRDPRLNELATDPLSLLEYDAYILSERNKP